MNRNFWLRADDCSFASDGGEPKSLEMVAYSGGVLHAGWGLEVLDLAGLSVAPRVPFLLQHDPSKRVGFMTRYENNERRLVVAGPLSNTPWAGEVVDDGDFPWQASVHVYVTKFEFVEEGKSVEVNGRTFEGPIEVIRESSLREVSVVAVGADQESEARVYMLDGGRDSASEQEDDPMENEQFERNVLAELNALFPDDPEFVVAQALAKTTPEEAAFAWIKREHSVATGREAAFQALRDDNEALKAKVAKLEARLVEGTAGVEFSAADPDADAEPDAPPSLDDEVAVLWRQKSTREEFPTEKALRAYLVAERAGRVRVLGAPTVVKQ